MIFHILRFILMKKLYDMEKLSCLAENCWSCHVQVLLKNERRQMLIIRGVSIDDVIKILCLVINTKMDLNHLQENYLGEKKTKKLITITFFGQQYFFCILMIIHVQNYTLNSPLFLVFFSRLQYKFFFFNFQMMEGQSQNLEKAIFLSPKNISV